MFLYLLVVGIFANLAWGQFITPPDQATPLEKSQWSVTVETSAVLKWQSVNTDANYTLNIYSYLASAQPPGSNCFAVLANLNGSDVNNSSPHTVEYNFLAPKWIDFAPEQKCPSISTYDQTFRFFLQTSLPNGTLTTVATSADFQIVQASRPTLIITSTASSRPTSTSTPDCPTKYSGCSGSMPTGTVSTDDTPSSQGLPISTVIGLSCGLPVAAIIIICCVLAERNRSHKLKYAAESEDAMNQPRPRVPGEQAVIPGVPSSIAAAMLARPGVERRRDEESMLYGTDENGNGGSWEQLPSYEEAVPLNHFKIDRPGDRHSSSS